MKISRTFFTLLSVMASAAVVVLALIIYSYSKLPDPSKLTNISYRVPLKIFSQDMKLIGQYGEKIRYPVAYDDIPPQLVNAFIAIEDQRFHSHFGVDPIGLARAVVNLIATGKKSQGASTITMQVARNFFLSSKKTWTRKINEILLSFKIERTLTKQQIIELYLNKIYLGNRAYGIAAAAEIYYGKTLHELTIAQMAMLAALPQAPSLVNPIRNKPAAVDRRNLVLSKMREEQYISEEQYQQATQEPDEAYYHGVELDASAPHISSLVHRLMLKAYGKKVHTAGYQVITTIDSRIQEKNTKIIDDALLEYSQNRGLNSLINIGTKRFLPPARWFENSSSPIPPLKSLAAVMEVTPYAVMIRTLNNQWRTIVLDNVKPGDLVAFQNDAWAPVEYEKPQAASAVLNTKTGAVIAMTGSANSNSSFNRATQAKRQMGSTFKPLLYAVALNNGLTLASTVNDAPFVSYGGDTDLFWRPGNHDSTYTGPMRLREAMIRSRNLVSIRLLEMIGIEEVKLYSQYFGLNLKNLPNDLSLALGSGLASPVEMSSAYTTFANEGARSKPFIAAAIYDQKGNIVIPSNPSVQQDGVYLIQQPSSQILTPEISYLMFNLLQDVVNRGTAQKAKQINRSDIGGKTGSTNGLKDNWFCGLNGEYSTTIWVGFDNLFTLKKYASQLALPIWNSIMANLLENKDLSTPIRPKSIITKRIDKTTGNPIKGYEDNSVFEIFDVSNQGIQAESNTPVESPAPQARSSVF